MIIKHCMKCSIPRATTNLNLHTCPFCGSSLGIKTISEDELSNYEVFDGDATAPAAEEIVPATDSNPVPRGPRAPAATEGGGVTTTHRPTTDTHAGSVREIGTVVRGRVYNYNNSEQAPGTYRRFFFTKWIDALVYGQRTEDVLHRFTVRSTTATTAIGDRNEEDIPVNVHGTISGGMQISDNAEVEVRGKYRNGVLMARSVTVLNNGRPTRVRFQHSARAILNTILAIVALAFMVYVGVTSNGNFFGNIWGFLKIWGISFVVFSVLYLILSLTRGAMILSMMRGRENRGGFPVFGIALTSFIAAGLLTHFINTFDPNALSAGIGNLFSNLLQAIGPLVVVIIGIVILLRIIF